MNREITAFNIVAAPELIL